MTSLNKNLPLRWHTFATTDDLERAAVQTILRAAREAITRRGTFLIVLAGGTTPRKVYELLRQADADWRAWQVYFGDERCLPPIHAERNSRMAALAWLDHVPIPRDQIHVIHAEAGAETAAADYTRRLNQIAMFDLVLLGLGEDGHTASLFPGHDHGTTHAAPAAMPVHDAPKLPPDRVSLSAQRLSASCQVVFLVTGEAKRQTVRDWRNGVNIPAAAITPASGADVYVEAALL